MITLAVNRYIFKEFVETLIQNENVFFLAVFVQKMFTFSQILIILWYRYEKLRIVKSIYDYHFAETKDYSVSFTLNSR